MPRTQMDKADSEPDLVMWVNGEGTRNVATACRDCGIPMCYLSTDYIFDGAKRTPYVPEDPPNPLNVYGRSKLAGEQAVQALCDDHCIVRTSWLYGWHGQNFVLTILRLAKERSELQVVDDQIGSPTWAMTLSHALAALIAKKARGIYHVTGSSDGISWYWFAVSIAEAVGAKTKVKPISSREWPRPARRPSYYVLSINEAVSILGFVLPSWDHSLHTMLSFTPRRMGKA